MSSSSRAMAGEGGCRNDALLITIANSGTLQRFVLVCYCDDASELLEFALDRASAPRTLFGW